MGFILFGVYSVMFELVAAKFIVNFYYYHLSCSSHLNDIIKQYSGISLGA